VLSVDASYASPSPPDRHEVSSGTILVDCCVVASSVNITHVESLIIVVDTRTDTDGDGVSDEVLVYGTNPTKADSDGDGMSDLEEVIAATDPILQSSRFVVQSLTSLPSAEGGGHNLSFFTSAGRKYAVSFTDDLTSGSWTALESDISGTGEAVSVFDTNTTVTIRYYKVHVEME
jgi:hypothetical protein